MAARTQEVLQEAKRQGWTAMAGPKHWKLVPPGGLSDVCPRPFILPHGANQRDRGDAFANSMRSLRSFGDPGKRLADTVEGSNGSTRGPKGAPGPQWIDPDPQAPPAPPDPAQFSAGVETITPTIAEKMLGDLYEGQRRLNERRVKILAEDIQAGRWTLSNDAVTFDANGRLINGQHRLHAIISAGVPVEALVVRGLPTASFDAMDTGMKRSMSDRLRSMGVADSQHVASALWRLHLYASTGEMATLRSRSVPSLLRLYETNQDIGESVVLARRCNWKFQYSVGFTAALIQLWRKVDAEPTEEFVSDLIEGSGPVGGPALLLREYMLARLTIPKSRRPSDGHYAALWVKAWNAYMRGDRPKALRVDRRQGMPAIWDPEDKLANLLTDHKSTL